jgi:hypothetical protein
VGHATLSRAGGRPDRLLSLSGFALLFLLILEEMYLLSGKYIFSFAAIVFLCIFAVSAFARASFHVRAIFLITLAISATSMVWLGSIEPLWVGLHRAEIFGAFIPAVIFLRASFQDYSTLFANVRFNANDRPNPLLRALTGNYALGSLLNVGSLHLLASNLTASLATKDLPKLAQAAALGVASAVMWSPFFVSMGFVSAMLTQVSLGLLILVCLSISVFSLLVFQYYLTGRVSFQEIFSSLCSFKSLAWPLLVVTVCILGCSKLFGFSGAQSVVLVAPLLAVLLMLYRPVTIRQTAINAAQGMSRISDELLIVIGAMLLSASVGSLPYLRELVASIEPALINPEVFILLSVLTLVGLGQIGLHPMIGASILVPLLSAQDFGIHPLIIGAMCVFAWGMSAAVSVWTLPISVSAAVFQVPVTRLVSRRLLNMALLNSFVISLLLCLLNRVLLFGT